MIVGYRLWLNRPQVRTSIRILNGVLAVRLLMRHAIGLQERVAKCHAHGSAGRPQAARPGGRYLTNALRVAAAASRRTASGVDAGSSRENVAARRQYENFVAGTSTIVLRPKDPIAAVITARRARDAGPYLRERFARSAPAIDICGKDADCSESLRVRCFAGRDVFDLDVVIDGTAYAVDLLFDYVVKGLRCRERVGRIRLSSTAHAIGEVKAAVRTHAVIRSGVRVRDRGARWNVYGTVEYGNRRCCASPKDERQRKPRWQRAIERRENTAKH